MNKQATVIKTPYGTVTIGGDNAEQLRRQSEMLDLMCLWALHLYGRGRAADALTILEQVLGHRPRHAEALRIRSRLWGQGPSAPVSNN